MERALGLLGVKPSEKKLFLWSFILAFITQVINCYLASVPMSLFLMKFSSENLPKVYLGIGLLTIIIGYVYTLFHSHFAFNRVVLGFFIVIGCVTTIFWCLLAGFNNVWIIALLASWSMVSFYLIDYSLWSVFNQIYNLQQAKRLFGLLGAGQSIGGVIAGLLLPVLLLFVAAQQVILLIGILILLASLPLIKLLNLPNKLQEERVVRETKTPEGTMRSIFSNKYIVKLMALVFLAIFLLYMVDILFNTFAKEHYPEEQALAGFLGLFFGVVEGASFVISAFIYRQLMERYGAVLSLLLYPALLITVSIFIFVSNLVPLLVLLTFWLVVLLKFFEASVRANLNGITIVFLLQPLPPALRLLMLSKNHLFITPLAAIIISLIMIAVTNTVGIITSYVLVAVVVCCVLYILITRTLNSDYIQSLTKAIANRYVLTSGVQVYSKESLPLFAQALRSPHPDVVVYALSTIEQINKAEFIKGLQCTFKSSSVDICTLALKKIGQYHVKAFYPQIATMLDAEPNNTLKAQAITSLAELDYNKAQSKIALFVDAPSARVHSAALIALWRFGNDSTKREVLEKIRQMLTSTQENVRKSAVFIIGEIKDRHANQLLEVMLHDPSKRIQREVLKSVIKTKQAALLNELLSHLYLLQLSGDLLNRFLAMGESMMPIIQKNFENYPTIVKLKLLHLMGDMQLKAATVFLETIVLSQHPVLQQIALRSIERASLPKDHIFLEKLHLQIKKEIQFLEKQHAFLRCIPEGELTQLLRDVLKRKVALGIERLMLSLSIYYQNKVIMNVKTELEVGNANKVSYALELLERVLHVHHKSAILPVLNNIYLSESSASNALDSQDFRAVIKKQLHIVDDEKLTILSCMACLYIIKNMDKLPFESEIKELKQSQLALIQETLAWVDV